MAYTTLAVPEPKELSLIKKRALAFRSLLDPEWRYTRSRNLHTDGVKYFDRDEDAWVERLTSFLNMLDSDEIDAETKAEDKYPDVYWAFVIYKSELQGPRFHLEALILTGKPTDEVADYLGLPTAVLLAYEQCFFDMRRHLDKQGAIETYIGARARARGLRDMDPDPFWKRIAIAEGEDMLHALWSEGILESKYRNKLDEYIASQARRNAVEAMRVRQVRADNAHEMIEEYGLILKTEIDRLRTEKEFGDSSSTIMKLVSEIYQAVQFSVAPLRVGENAYMELSTAAAQAPLLLERLRGSTLENQNVGPEQSD